MPVLATPASPTILSRDDIRAFVRDVAGVVPNTGAINILLDGPLWADSDIDRGIRFTVAKYNAMTPISNVGQDSINIYVLLNGVVAFLLRSEGVRQLNQQATVQDGDVAPIGVEDKQALYAQQAKMFDEEFTIYARGIKTQLNMQSAYGGLGSGYRATSRYTHA
jgi:hypothetical protein